jgi:hypothetical protein
MGIDPAPFFPADESWLDEYQWWLPYQRFGRFPTECRAITFR